MADVIILSMLFGNGAGLPTCEIPMKKNWLYTLLATACCVALGVILASQGVQAQDGGGSIGKSAAPTTEAPSSGDEGDSTDGESVEDDAALTPDQELEQLLAGHSIHGEAFNEGPRQRAYLMGSTGNVRFPVTTQSPLAGRFIEQGVGQLHGFWDLEAERSFRQAMTLDENCAMAYWGAAMAAWQDRKRARGFIEQAVQRLEGVTKREEMYIRAAERYFAGDEGDSDAKKKRAERMLKDLEDIVLDYPDDLEAKAFVVHRIWQNAREGIPVASYLAADSLLDQIFDQEPLHPAHHYCIHLWDYRRPERALRSAARCGPSAPAIAHMWHMPGHIYSRLKRYEDAVYQQEASARVDHAYMIRDRVMPDEIHNYAHNNEWLIRNLVFVGRAGDAADLAMNMLSLPRHPRYNSLDKRNGSYSYGRRRLLQVLREFQMYEPAVELCQSAFLQIDFDEDGLEWVKTQRLLGCSAAILGRDSLTQQVKTALADIRRQQQTLVDSHEPVDKSADENSATDSDSSGEDSRAAEEADGGGERSDQSGPGQPASVEPPAADEQELQRKVAEAKSIVKAIDKALLAIDGYQDVRSTQFKSAADKLTRAGGEDLAWIGELKFLGGEKEAGVKQIRDQVRRRPSEAIPLARLAYVLGRGADDAGAVQDVGTDVTDGSASSPDDGTPPGPDSTEKPGQPDADVQAAFRELGEATRSLDFDVEMFARLKPIAERHDVADQEWLTPIGPRADVGFRPPLDSLGPFRWEPSLAPRWTARDRHGNEVSSTRFEGQPCLVIFYLGHGCLHCVEQLQTFAPWVSRFEEMGVNVIAISTDTVQDLDHDIAMYDGDMPYDIHLADPDGVTFRRYRAWDDFENQPLHGTFLIDADGRIRWQDIGYEPFGDPKFLFGETRRVLQPSGDKRPSLSNSSR